MIAEEFTVFPYDDRTRQALTPFDGDFLGRVLVRLANPAVLSSEDWAPAVDELTGRPVVVRRADCGLGCRCAAEVRFR